MKIYSIKKIVITTLVLSTFFVSSVSTSFAVITAPTELKTPAMLFEFPRKADSLPAEKQTLQVNIIPTPSSASEITKNKENFFSFSTFMKIKEITGCVLNNFSSDFSSLFKKTGLVLGNIYNSLTSNLMNFRNSFFQEIQKINGSAFTTSASNLKIFFNQTAQIIKNVYNSLSSYLINLRN